MAKMTYPDERVYIQCDCHSHEHILTVDLNDYSGEHGPDHMLSFGVQLNSYLPWWKRVLEAAKFILRVKPDCGHWDCMIVSPKDALAIEGLIMAYLKRVGV